MGTVQQVDAQAVRHEIVRRSSGRRRRVATAAASRSIPLQLHRYFRKREIGSQCKGDILYCSNADGCNHVHNTAFLSTD